MNSELVVFLSIFLTLGFELIVTAALVGVEKSSVARLLQMGENATQHERAIKLINSAPRPGATLHVLQTVSRFFVMGLTFWIVVTQWDGSIGLGLILSLSLFGLTFAWLEWVVFRQVSREPEKWLLQFERLIQAIGWALYPLARISLFLSRDSNSSYEDVGVVTEDELKIMVEAGQQEGILEQEERQMIDSIFQLGDTLSREIMVPRIEMLALDVQTPMFTALDAFLDSGYSRVPIFEERVDNVIGILYAKDILKVWRDSNGNGGSIRTLLREPYFVPEAKKVDELLAEMQQRRVHMAIVVDEYGGVAGVVTLEDIIEEILGEIQDEYDEEDLPYQAIDDDSYLFRGRIDIDDFNHIMGSDLPTVEADTLSGFIYGRLGHVPVAGEVVHFDSLNLVVEQVSNRRIRKVRAKRIKPNQKPMLDGEHG